ncbi:MAG: YifB family Mg chelatase-like AAA ATPase [Lachnospiraceae bacterium]|nr:YifB family Mg chelatase-like AAA ATPase [Lachnospiraceae bacterium]
MFGKADTSAIVGIDGKRVVVEADFGDGLPEMNLVGFLGSEVKEAKERVRSAIKNSGVIVPPGKLTVNLSPADLRKQGNSFDLPIAVAILIAIGVLPEELARPYDFVGELALDGTLRPVNGCLSHVILSRALGKKGTILPFENAREAALFPDHGVYALHSLSEVMAFLMAPDEEKRAVPGADDEALPEHQPDFSEVFGQESVKRAAMVAAAGMHGFLMIGPPGTGKTLTARRIPTILPPLTEEESIECTKIYSVAGLLHENDGLVRIRPFRSPHHTVSANGLVGGGSIPKPGEMTLAHNGILFLDELPEFSKAALEVMRQPLEDHEVTISRVHGTYTFPTRVMLVLAMNPCKCGFYPDRNKCSCSEADVRKYLSRISRPLLDRVDIVAEVPRINVRALGKDQTGADSASMKEQVIRAWEVQKERYRSMKTLFNSGLEGKEIRRFCRLSADCETLLSEAMEKLELSLRARDRILKVSRTIADLSGEEEIQAAHLAEAVSYRSLDRKFWR